MKVVLLLLLCEILMWLPCYVGDVTNLPVMFLAFTAGILFGCEGTLQQKLAAAVLTAGPAFAVNVLTNNRRRKSEVRTESQGIYPGHTGCGDFHGKYTE